MVSKSWILAASLLASPAAAEDLREFCPDRPGIGSPPCIVDKGRLAIEVGVADWTLDRQPDARTDLFQFGDILLRYGLSDTLEVQFDFLGVGHRRTRDRVTDMVDHATDAGDVIVALRQNLRSPDGSGFSIALQPFAALPVGGDSIGAGDWGGGLLVPVSYDLSDKVQLTGTGEIDAAVDEDGNGRHLAYGAVAGLQASLGEDLDASLEVMALRDRDPQGHATQLLAGISAGWTMSDSFQIDGGVNAGLNHESPDVELYVGFSRRF